MAPVIEDGEQAERIRPDPCPPQRRRKLSRQS